MNGNGWMKSMLSVNLDYVEGVVDVSIIVPTCFENPLKKLATDFLGEVLSLRRKAIIPVTAVLGAYHIATRYLRAPRRVVKKILVEMLETRSPALYPRVSVLMAVEALDVATTYNIESWDGYIIALAQSFKTKIVYTLDSELKKVREIIVVNPFPPEKVDEYHEYLQALLETKH